METMLLPRIYFSRAKNINNVVHVVMHKHLFVMSPDLSSAINKSSMNLSDSLPDYHRSAMNYLMLGERQKRENNFHASLLASGDRKEDARKSRRYEIGIIHRGALRAKMLGRANAARNIPSKYILLCFLDYYY